MCQVSSLCCCSQGPWAARLTGLSHLGPGSEDLQVQVRGQGPRLLGAADSQFLLGVCPRTQVSSWVHSEGPGVPRPGRGLHPPTTPGCCRERRCPDQESQEQACRHWDRGQEDHGCPGRTRVRGLWTRRCPPGSPRAGTRRSLCPWLLCGLRRVTALCHLGLPAIKLVGWGRRGTKEAVCQACKHRCSHV